jgi:hypothetical protein
MELTYIYTLSDPMTNEVRYVGKCNNPKERYKAHLNKARDKNTHKRNWINKLRDFGLKPTFEIIDIVPINNWHFWERYWISQFKTWGFKLMNYTDGGDGSSNGNQGSFKPGQNSKKVVGYNNKFDKVYEFNSSTEASKLLNIHRSSIPTCCKYNDNSSKTIKGFTWFFYDDIKNISNDELIEKIKDRFTKNIKPNSGNFQKGGISPSSKKVNMYDMDNKLIKQFNSIKECYEHFNTYQDKISSIMKTYPHIYKGYILKSN